MHNWRVCSHDMFSTPPPQLTVDTAVENLRALADNQTVGMGLRSMLKLLKDETEGPQNLEKYLRRSPECSELWAVWERQMSGSDRDVSSALLLVLGAMLQHPRASRTQHGEGDSVVEVRVPAAHCFPWPSVDRAPLLPRPLPASRVWIPWPGSSCQRGCAPSTSTCPATTASGSTGPSTS